MAYIDFWKRWKDYSGKTGRAEYWSALLLHVVISLVLAVLLCVILISGFRVTSDEAVSWFDTAWLFWSLSWFVPFSSMTVRRFRDAGFGKRNFWKLLIPGIGIIALFLGHYEKERIVSEN